ncbi:polysaccharide biosynthesis/export family protein [Anditalea andensis]|uniref:Membrane protein n=1 Tax=Anditalea andensis TaxID=1048983 RepID=A0A074LES4_9BACT|nr:polysaccharide biosynthesis/export family protein [Anditalea andensis]KEO72292.1 membrane protein [Anditalea andensis]
MKKTLTYFIISLIMLSSCRSSKNIPYFKNIPLSEYSKITQSSFTEPIIQQDDVLDIIIQTTEPLASLSVKAAAVEAPIQSPGGQVRVPGFIVDKNGEVEMPVVGTVRLEGLTTYEARQVIRKKAAKFYVDPAVQVRFLNFTITVIGEVNRPSNYTVPNEKVNILDAIGMAGDLTIFGKRENVLLIREGKDGKEMVRFNLNDAEVFNSPYYFLRQNDIIYVEPSKARIASTDATRLSALAIIATIISSSVLAASILL